MPLTDDEVFSAPVAAKPAARGGGMTDEEVFGKAAAQPTSPMDEKPKGFVEEFKKAFKGNSVEGVWGLLKESLPANLWKAATGTQQITSRKQIEAAALLRANQIVKDQQSWPAESVKKAYELLAADAAKKKRESDEGVFDASQEMIAGALENPGAAAAELANSLIRDPEQVLPIFGQIGKGTTWASRVAGVTAAGAGTNAAIEAAAGGAKGEADPTKIAGAAVAGGAIGAPFALIGKTPGRMAAETKERALGLKKAAENDTILDMAERYAGARPPAEPPGFIPPKDLSKMKPKERAAYDKARAAFEERYAADQEAAANYDPEAMQVDIEASLARYFEDAQDAIPPEPRAEPPRYNTPEAPDAELPLGNMAGKVPKGSLAEPPIVGETPPAPTPADPHITLFESARDKVIGGRAWDLTADEKVALRGHVGSVTRDGVIDPQTSRARGQRGEVDPKLLGMMAAGALGAAVLGTDWTDDDAKKYIAAGIAGSMGLVGKGRPFYHAVPEVLARIPRKAGTAAEWAKEFDAAAGKVGKGTAEEWKAMGGPEWLAEQTAPRDKHGPGFKVVEEASYDGGKTWEQADDLGHYFKTDEEARAFLKTLPSPDIRAYGSDADNVIVRLNAVPEPRAWLERETPKVTREEIEEFVRDHSVEVGETVRGASPEQQAYDAEYAKIAQAHGLPPDHTDLGPYLTEAESDRLFALESAITSEAPRYDTPSYKTPGGTNYRETVYTVPEKGETYTGNGYETVSHDYQSTHWPEPNVVAHTRTQDFTTPDGKLVHHIDEVQSDWAQQLRDHEKWKGLKEALDKAEDERFKAQTSPREYDAAAIKVDAADQALREFEDKHRGSYYHEAPPPGPFIHSTEAATSLAVRREIARAVAEGKDYVTWAPGKEHSKRYGGHAPEGMEGFYGDEAGMTGGKPAPKYKPGELRVMQNEDFATYSINDSNGMRVSGKKYASRQDAIDAMHDLQMQGPATPQKPAMLTSIVEKILKKLGGGKVESVSIGEGGSHPKKFPSGVWALVDGQGNWISSFPSEAAALKAVPDYSNIRTVPGFRITPEMRQRVAAGMPLFGRQGGFIDPKLSAALGLGVAGAAVGAWIGGQDKAKQGAIMGALAGIAAALGALKKPGAAINWGLGLVSREFNQLDPRLRRVMTHFERESLEQNLRDHVKAAPFVEIFHKMKAADKEAVALALAKGTTEARVEVAAKYPRLALALDAADALIKEKSDWLRSERRFKNGPEYYWHRQVKDLDGLLEALGKEESGSLAAELIKLENRVKAQADRLPTEMERAEVVADWMRQTKAGLSHRAGYSNKRTVEMTPELLKFYHDPATALLAFLAEANKDISRTKLFGKNAVNKTQDGIKYLNVEASIGNVVQKQLAEGRLTNEQAKRLRSLLRSRLGPGEQSMPGWHQDIQNVVSASLLGHITNAVKQVPDFAMGTLLVGLRPTLQAVIDGLRGKSKIRLNELGLINNIMDEYTATRASAKYLDYVLRRSGFSAIDVGARHTIVNAALAKYTRDAVKGGKELTRKYGKAFTADELNQMKSDLVRGEKTPLVRDLVFMELSDIQPISRLEKPQAYLDHPSGRFMYHLKSYTLKQLDIARREVLDNWKAGRRAEALGKAAGLALVWGMIGAATDTFVDFLLGQKTKLEDKVIDTMARNLGWSDWVATQLKGEPGRAGNAAAAAGQLLAPPAVGVAYDIATLRPQAMRHVPLIGRLLYAYVMGGTMQAQERELIKNGGLPQVKEQREAREEAGQATALDKERVRMQKQKVDDQERKARKAGQEEKADKLLERSEKLRGRLEKMALSDATGAPTMRPWHVLESHLNQNAAPWNPPPGFFPEDRGNVPRGPRVIDDRERRERVRKLLKVM